MCCQQRCVAQRRSYRFSSREKRRGILEDSEWGLLCLCGLWLGRRGSWLPWVPERSGPGSLMWPEGPAVARWCHLAQGGLVCRGAWCAGGPREQAGAQPQGRGSGERAEALNSRSGCHPIGTTKLGAPGPARKPCVVGGGFGVPPHDSASQTGWHSGQRGAWGGGSPDFTPPSPGGEAAPFPRAPGLTAAPSTSRPSSSTSTGWSSESAPVRIW